MKEINLNQVVFKDKEKNYEIKDIVSITQFNGGIVVVTKDGTIYSEKENIKD